MAAPAPRRRHTAAPEPVVPPASSAVDLHTHTRRSDGVLEPRALVKAAAACGVQLLAIADHDTLAACRELAGPGAADLPVGLTLLPAVEINAVAHDIPDLREGELHILGYGVDPDDEAFEALLGRQRDARRVRFARTLDRLRELGLPVDAGAARLDPGAGDSLGRPTLARLLVEAGYAASVDDAFDRILGLGRPGYVPRDGLGPAAAIRAIRAAGGLAVLAHFAEATERRTVVRDLVEQGLGGLEVHYRTFDRATVGALARLAGDLALVPTGGSDYHGDSGPYAALHAGLWVPPEAGERLLAALGRPTAAGHAERIAR